MIVTETRAELAGARGRLTGRVAVVMTMGALHAGHLDLLRTARRHADAVLMTLFVNPLQFGPNEDFDAYPRTREDDLSAAKAAGVDLVFAPAAAEVYPAGAPTVRVEPGPLGAELEGASRPGFFHGVLTVVLKLLHLTRPDVSCFGEKDYQQLTLIRAMVRDLDLGVEIVGVPTVREPDGLAFSSRNRYLAPDGRDVALTLSRALAAAQQAAQRAVHRPRGGPEPALAAVLAAARAVFAAEPRADLDYLEVRDPALGPAPAHGAARILVAARVGGTRLIDNAPLDL